MNRPTLTEELALDRTEEVSFRRTIHPRWSYADRVFGGYTSALALAAAHRVSSHPAALAAHVMFPAGPVPGEGLDTEDGVIAQPPPAPERCPPMRWLTDAYPFLEAFEEGAIDYPSSREDFRDGPASIELWARPRRRPASAPPADSRGASSRCAEAAGISGS